VSRKTKRRVFLSLLMVAMMLPAEVVLLKALQTPNDKVAADEWVANLDSTAVDSAASSIQSYSLPYRRAIMSKLNASQRAKVWRDHIDQYIAGHPGLDRAQLNALQAGQSALTSTALGDKATAAERAALEDAGRQIEAALGVEEADYIARYLGTKDTSLANAEPLLDKLANFVRNQFILMARLDQCDCAGDRDCGYYVSYCDTSYPCQSDSSWPMCGYWWNTPCNGMCSFI
jgi:hypothetical protein